MPLPFAISFPAVFKELLSFILTFFLALGGYGSLPANDLAPQDAANLQAQFSIISDTHIEINPAEEGVVRFEALRKGLKDMSRSAAPNDALIIAGDMTENGQVFEYSALYDYLRRFSKLPRFLPAMGNHETFGLNHNQLYPIAQSNFTGSYRIYSGINIDKPYYYQVINGYYFVVMGTEAISGEDMAYIYPEQLSWLEGVLAQATADGKPVFLINHEPFAGTHGTTNWAESMGAQNDAVYAVVSQFSNVFYFSGHIHVDLEQSRSYARTAEGVNLFSLPTYGKSATPGCGLQVEVYPDSVLVRGRNFAKGAWLGDFSVTVALD